MVGRFWHPRSHRRAPQDMARDGPLYEACDVCAAGLDDELQQQAGRTRLCA